MTTDKPLYVTTPSLPPLGELMPYLEKIWDRRILSNGGPAHQELEAELAQYLGVPYLSLFNNGTNALISALSVAELSGEVITTPFSFIATAHSLIWNNLKPVFVDIDEQSYNIDPQKIEAAITPETSAILAVHCYGNVCDLDAIQAIADKHGLKVIYDAAHAFGVKNDKGSILNAGDFSVLSFQATKVYNTFEGGAVICHDEDTKRKLDRHKNFGITDEVSVDVVGLNGKMSEFNAAFGLLQLKYVDDMIDSRARVDGWYRQAIGDIEGIRCLDFSSSARHNYSYFPIQISSPYPKTRDELFQAMKDVHVFARRYFYPLMSDFKPYRDLPSAAAENLPVAKKCSDEILCLPLSAQMTQEDTNRVIKVIKECL